MIRPSPRGGFTLIEVLLALAIFVGATAAISRLIVLGIDNAQFCERQTEMRLIAESRFAELDAGVLTPVSVSDQPVEEFPDYQWDMTADTTELTGLMLVTVTVRNISTGPAAGMEFQLIRNYLDETAVIDATTTTDSTAATAASSGTSSPSGTTP